MLVIRRALDVHKIEFIKFGTLPLLESCLDCDFILLSFWSHSCSNCRSRTICLSLMFPSTEDNVGGHSADANKKARVSTCV